MVPLQVPNGKKNTHNKNCFKASRIRKVIEKTKNKFDDIGNKSSSLP